MQFNDTTNRTGLIQECEFWTNLGVGGISGDSVQLAEFTRLINNAGYDEVLPIVLSNDAKWQWDDPNHTDHPIATTDIVLGQPDYSFVADEHENSILEIDELFAKDPTGVWHKLHAVDSKTDSHTERIFAQNTTNIGTPKRYDKLGTAIWLDPVPNYEMTGGIRAVFKRSPVYFTDADTTKTPGIPQPFHRLLAMIPSRDWVAVHKPENTTLLNLIVSNITTQKAQLALHMNKRSGDEQTVLRARVDSSR